MRIKLLLLLAAICSSAFAQVDSDDFDERQAYTLFMNCMRDEMYEAAEPYIYYLEKQDTLSDVTLLHIADCYIYLDKLPESALFCLNHKDRSIQTSALLASRLGECYFLNKEYDKACEYFEEYVKWCKENEHEPLGYYDGQYGVSLYKEHHYAESKEHLEMYFADFCEDENLEFKEIYRTQYKDEVGKRLYYYALSLIFLGDEESGKAALELSALCDTKEAKEDLARLKNCYSFAKSPEYSKKIIKQFESTLAELDLYKYMPRHDASAFWGRVKEKNPTSKELRETLQRKNLPGTLKNAVAQVSQGMDLFDNPKAFNAVEPDAFEEYIRKHLCGKNDFLKDLRIYPAKGENAFATPYGHIYYTSGLCETYHYDADYLIAVGAHEAAHFVLQHSLTQAWKQAKKEKNNRVWSGIAMGLGSAAMVASQYYAASNGVGSGQPGYWDSYNTSIVNMNNSIMMAFEKDNYYFKFKYSRNHELEADILAYRFCESIGLGGYVYIYALELINDGSTSMEATKTSDHPTDAFRIGLLKYLYAKEHQPQTNTEQ